MNRMRVTFLVLAMGLLSAFCYFIFIRADPNSLANESLTEFPADSLPGLYRAKILRIDAGRLKCHLISQRLQGIRSLTSLYEYATPKTPLVVVKLCKPLASGTWPSPGYTPNFSFAAPSYAFEYRGCDLEEGDIIDFHVVEMPIPGFLRHVQRTPPPEVLAVCIVRRPGGIVPRSTEEPRYDNDAHSIRMNREQAFEEFGPPLVWPEITEPDKLRERENDVLEKYRLRMKALGEAMNPIHDGKP